MKMGPKTRKVALELGLPTYCTGKPCGNGHISPRYTNNKCCIECQRTTHKDSRAKLIAKWRKDHVSELVEKKRVNNESSRIKAIHARKPWTQKQIEVINRRKADGDYVLTAQRLGEIMGRSIASIEAARERYRSVIK